MINVKRVNKYYPIGKSKFHALKDACLHIEQGEMVCIIGASGSGKSTLLHILGGLDDFDSGEYIFNGTSVGKLSDSKCAELRNKHIGFVMQDFALVNDQTVLFNVMLPLMFGKTKFSTIKQKALAALERVGLISQKNKKINQLSGGQKQRIAIARAIVNDPLLILADEPTGALDSETSSEIMDLLTELNNSGNTVVIVTHDPIVMQRCKRTINITDGIIS